MRGSSPGRQYTAEIEVHSNQGKMLLRRERLVVLLSRAAVSTGSGNETGLRRVTNVTNAAIDVR